MTVSTHRRVLVGAVAAAALATASLGAYADTSTVPVTTAVVNGTRTLSVTDPTGAAIGNGGLALGRGHAGAFLVNVTDANYSHAGYQVSATMTNLYPYANGSYDFTGTPIPSNRISVDYPGGLLGLVNVKTLVTPVVELTGTLDLGGLGLAVPVDTTVDGTTQSVQTLTDNITQDTLASVLGQLPVTLGSGETGTFDSPGDLPGEPGTPHANPTSKVLMSGNAQSPQTLVDALVSALDTDLGGETAKQLVDAGVLDQDTVISAVAQVLGVVPSLLTATQIDTILNGLTGTVTGLTGGIVGQTGSYNAMPALSVDLPANTASGLYRGQLVVTLMDK